jgi:hypothetical protein
VSQALVRRVLHARSMLKHIAWITIPLSTFACTAAQVDTPRPDPVDDLETAIDALDALDVSTAEKREDARKHVENLRHRLVMAGGASPDRPLATSAACDNLAVSANAGYSSQSKAQNAASGDATYVKNPYSQRDYEMNYGAARDAGLCSFYGGAANNQSKADRYRTWQLCSGAHASAIAGRDAARASHGYDGNSYAATAKSRAYEAMLHLYSAKLHAWDCYEAAP